MNYKHVYRHVSLQVTCASDSAALMAAYASQSGAAVTDKLTGVLKDWAKVKAAFYDMDNKIAQVRVCSLDR